MLGVEVGTFPHYMTFQSCWTSFDQVWEENIGKRSLEPSRSFFGKGKGSKLGCIEDNVPKGVVPTDMITIPSRSNLVIPKGVARHLGTKRLHLGHGYRLLCHGNPSQ